MNTLARPTLTNPFRTQKINQLLVPWLASAEQQHQMGRLIKAANSHRASHSGPTTICQTTVPLTGIAGDLSVEVFEELVSLIKRDGLPSPQLHDAASGPWKKYWLALGWSQFGNL